MTIRRQDIQTAVLARLATITTGNGYHTEIGANVLSGRGRAIDGSYIPIEGSELPCVLPRFPVNEATRVNMDGVVEWQMTAELEVRCEEGSSTETFLNQATADIYSAVGTDERWSGFAEKTMRVTDETVVGKAERLVGISLLKLAIVYRTSGWDES